MSPTNPPRHLERLCRRSVLRIAAGALLLPAVDVHAADDPARAFIQQVGDETVAILSRPGASQSERLRDLTTLLNEATDLKLVGRLVLGQYWRQANEAQRDAYLELFRALVVKTMADRLNTYGGETFQITGSKAVDDRNSVVSTKIFRPASGSQPIAVDWRVRSIDGQLAIIDIVAEGVSMIVTQRSEVGSVVSQKGMDGLIATLKERLERPA